MTCGNVLPLVGNWRRMRGQELTRADKEIFGGIDSEDFYNRVYSRLPGEAPHVERINPVDGTVVYVDSHKRGVIRLSELGYQISGEN